MSVSHRGMINLTAPLARGLIGFWTLGDGGVRNAVSGVAATPVGTTPRTPSAVGFVRRFNGSSDRVPLPVLISGYPLTVIALARITAAAATFPVIWGAGNSANDGFWMLLGADGTAGGLRVGVSGTVGVGATNICDGRWRVLAGTWSASGAGIGYVDGREETTHSTTLFPTLTQAAIGCLPRSTNVSFAGADIAYVGLWNRALSAGEIRQHSADPDMLHTERKRALRLPQSVSAEFIRGGFRYASSPAGTPRYRGGFKKL